MLNNTGEMYHSSSLSEEVEYDCASDNSGDNAYC